MRTLHGLLSMLVASMVTVIALPARTAGADPDIFEFTRAAVQRKEIRKTEMAGFGIINTDYRDVPRDGAVLVGFDLALRNQGDALEIAALRPRYRTVHGDIVGQSAGSFSSTRDHKITQVERIDAKPGYAVGSVTLHTGIGILGMSVKFMRITGASLDPKDSYRSPWIGRRATSSHDKVLSSRGGPVAGIYGNVHGPHVLALGLLTVDPPDHEETSNGDGEVSLAPPPTNAVTEPATVEVLAPEAPAKTSLVLPMVIGGIVVVMVGGALLTLNWLLSNLNAKPATPFVKPAPAGLTPNVEVTRLPAVHDDMSIPVVSLAEPS